MSGRIIGLSTGDEWSASYIFQSTREERVHTIHCSGPSGDTRLVLAENVTFVFHPVAIHFCG